MAERYIDFEKFMRDWFGAYHLHQMPQPIRARWDELRGDDYDVITAETQGLYRDYLDTLTNIGDTKEVEVQKIADPALQASYLAECRLLSGNPALEVGDKFTITIATAADKEAYLRVASKRIGDRFYYNDYRSGARKGFGDKKTGELADNPIPDISQLDLDEQKRLYKVIRDRL